MKTKKSGMQGILLKIADFPVYDLENPGQVYRWIDKTNSRLETEARNFGKPILNSSLVKSWQKPKQDQITYAELRGDETSTPQHFLLWFYRDIGRGKQIIEAISPELILSERNLKKGYHNPEEVSNLWEALRSFRGWEPGTKLGLN